MKHTNFVKNDEVLLKVDFIFEPIKENWALIKIKDHLYMVEMVCDEFPGNTEAHIRHVYLTDSPTFFQNKKQNFT